MNSNSSKQQQIFEETIDGMRIALENNNNNSDSQRLLHLLKSFSTRFRDDAVVDTRDLNVLLNRVLCSTTPDVNSTFRDVVYMQKSRKLSFVETAFLNVRLNAEAVNVSLRTMRISEPRTLTEEHVDNVILAIKCILKTVVFPALDASRRGLLLVAQRKEDEEEKLEESASNLSKFEKFGSVDMLHVCHEMMRRLTGLISVVRLQDRQLLEASQIALSTLCVFGRKIASLQLVSLDTIEVIFYKYVKLREIIIQDILTSMAQFSMPGKSSCMYKITPSCGIQMSSAIILRLAHVSSPGGVETEDENDEPSSYLQNSKKKKKKKKMTTKKGKNNKKHTDEEERIVEPRSCAVPLFQSMLRFLITKCRSKDQFKMHARILEDFVKDVLEVLHRPEWPASLQALEIISEQLSQILTLKSSSSLSTPSSSLSTKKEYTGLINLSVKILGLVARRVYSDILLVQDDEENFGLQQDKDEKFNNEGRPDDDGEIVNCVCGNTNAPDSTYDFMLDCDQCHVWFHGKCVGIPTAEDLPDRYVCDRCLIREQVELELARMKARRVEDEMESSVGKRKKVHQKSHRPKKRSRRFETISSDDDDDDEEEQEETSVSPDLNLFVARQLLLNFITLQAQNGDRNAALSRQYLIVQWIRHDRERFENDDESGNERFHESSKVLLDQWNLPESQVHQIAALSRARSVLICREDSANRVLRTLSERLLHRILGSLMQTRISVRADAVKAVGMILDVDPDIMNRPVVKSSVEARLSDKSIKVREAVLDLVGKHIVARQSLASEYYEIIQGRLQDKGVSVRKRAVKILRNILISQPKHPKRVDTCTCLLNLYDNEILCSEKSLRDIVQDTLFRVWFEETISGQGGYDNLALEFVQITEQNSSQLLSIFKTFWESHNNNEKRDVVVVAAADDDDDDEDDNEEDSFDKILGRTKSIVKSLVKLLLDSEELVGTSQDIVLAAQRLTGVLRTLLVFAELDATLLIPHFETLCLHLKPDPHLDSSPKTRSDRILIFAAKIVSLVVSRLSNPSRDMIRGLLNDLRDVIFRREPHVVEIYVECLSATCEIMGRKGRLEILEIVRRMYRYLDQRRNVPSLQDLERRVLNSIERALFTVGVICRYVDFNDKETIEEEEEKDDDIKLDSLIGLSMSQFKKKENGSKITNRNVYESFYRICCDFASKAFLTVSGQALSAICSLSSRRPRFALRRETQNLLKLSLSSKDERVCGVAIESLCMMLEADEARVQKQRRRTTKIAILNKKKNKKKSKNKNKEEKNAAMMTPVEALRAQGVSYIEQVSADQTPESGMIIGALQPHQDQIEKLLWHSSNSIREASLRLVTLLLRRGIINPITCSKRLIALQADKSDKIRQVSLSLLVQEHSKRPDLISCGVVEGVAGCFYIKRRMMSHHRSRRNESILGDLYVHFMRENPKLQTRFLRVMANAFDDRKHRQNLLFLLQDGEQLKETIVASELRPLVLRVLFLRFLAVEMSKIPFTFADEPLTLIHTLSCVGSIRGEMLSEEITRFVQEKENSSSSNGKVITLESRSRGLAALAITIGLQLRRHLQVKYNLSENKCRLFNASKPISSSSSSRERVTTTTSQQSSSFPNQPETDIWTIVGYDENAAFNSLRNIHDTLIRELKHDEDGSMLPPQPRNMAVFKTVSNSSSMRSTNNKNKGRLSAKSEIVMSKIGKSIEKKFEGYGHYKGDVISFNEELQVFLIKYEDNDQEELELSVLEKYIVEEF